MRRTCLVDVPLEKNSERQVTVRGENYFGALSAFDFPTKLLISISDDGASAEIECVYVSSPDEPTQEDQHSEKGATVFVGVHSGRILKLRVALSKARQGHSKVELSGMMQNPLHDLKSKASKLTWKQGPVRRLAHYKMFPDLLPLIDDKLTKLQREL